MTFIRDQRDNPLESTKGQYFTFDTFVASSFLGSESDFARALTQDTTYHAFGRPNHRFVFARSTTIGLEQVYRELTTELERWRPDAVAIEEVFYSVNAKSALKLGQVRGMA